MRVFFEACGLVGLLATLCLMTLAWQQFTGALFWIACGVGVAACLLYCGYQIRLYASNTAHPRFGHLLLANLVPLVAILVCVFLGLANAHLFVITFPR